MYVVGSRFTANVCSNGAALSSIGVSWTVLNSTFTGNRAIGRGANPAQAGTPGGGSGGAIYNDGDQMTLTVAGSVFTHNHANEGGGAIFFVSDDRTGYDGDPRQRARQQPQRRLPHLRAAGDLLPRRAAAHDHSVDPAVSGAPVSNARRSSITSASAALLSGR